MFDPKKVEYLKTELKFSDAEIAAISESASSTEKAATDQGVAFKADEPTELPDLVINGVTYKAFPPKKDDEAAVEAVIEEDAFVEEVVEEEAPADENALTLSAGDLAAISEAIQGAVATIMGGLDLEKKVASHVQGFLQPLAQAQTTKDAEQAATKEQLTQLQQQVAELTGDQPAAGYRASQARDNIISDARLLEAVKAANPSAGPFDDIIQGLGLARPQ